MNLKAEAKQKRNSSEGGKNLSLFVMLSVAKMRFVASHSRHKIEIFQVVWFLIHLLLPRRISDWCRLIKFSSFQRLEFQFIPLLYFVFLVIDYSNDVDSAIKVKSVHMSETKHGWRKSERLFSGQPDKSRCSFPAKTTEKTFFILLIPDEWCERDFELFDFVVFRTGQIYTKAHEIYDETVFSRAQFY